MKISVDDVLMMINPARNPAWKKALSLCIVLLFWEQTEIEKISRKTMYANNMGYNQADAPAATAWSKKILANFNPNDPLSEIMDMPSEFIEQARTMVIRYRKQIAQKLTDLSMKKDADNLDSLLHKEPVIDDIKLDVTEIDSDDLTTDAFFNRFEKARG